MQSWGLPLDVQGLVASPDPGQLERPKIARPFVRPCMTSQSSRLGFGDLYAASQSLGAIFSAAGSWSAGTCTVPA